MAEDNIIKALIEIIFRREGVRFKIESEPEKVNRKTKDIEAILVYDNRRIAVEHTRMESFTNQISNVHRLIPARTRIEEELKGHVPDDRYFVLTLPVEYLCALRKRDMDKQVSAIITWVMQESRHLGEKRTAKLTLPNAEQYVWLECRWSSKMLNGTVITSLLSPKSLDQKRSERYEKIYRDKLSKLHRYEECNYETVLALEDIDISLSNSSIAGELLQQISHHHKSVIPMSIYYFATTNENDIYEAYIFKEGDKWLENITHSGPFTDFDK
ncbi:MAG: hypothetical protein ABSC11_12945 [Smithella sp.]|jgi:hypothetical protein